MYKEEDFKIEWAFKTPKKITVNIFGDWEDQYFSKIDNDELKNLIYSYIETKNQLLFSDCDGDEQSTVMYLVINDNGYSVTDSIDSLIVAIHRNLEVYLINIEDNLL
jgi:hypothetical protein